MTTDITTTEYSIDVRDAGATRGRWTHQASSTPEMAAAEAVAAARRDGAIGALYVRVYAGHRDTPVGGVLLLSMDVAQ